MWLGLPVGRTYPCGVDCQLVESTHVVDCQLIAYPCGVDFLLLEFINVVDRLLVEFTHVVWNVYW